MFKSLRNPFRALMVGAACLVLVACCSPDSIATDQLPDGAVGQAYSASLESNCTTEGHGCSEWSVGGSLPPGLTFFKDGRITGTPILAGRFTITIDLQGCSSGSNVTATRSFLVTIVGT